MNELEIYLMLLGAGYLFVEKFFKTSKDDESEFSKSTKGGKILLFTSIILALGSVFISYNKSKKESAEKKYPSEQLHIAITSK